METEKERMMKQRRLLLVIAAIGVMSLCSQADANLLTGGDFDSANDLSVTPGEAAWTIGGTYLPQISGDTSGLAPQGASAGYLALVGFYDESDEVVGGWAYQDVTVTPGQQYRLEFYYGVRGTNTNARVTVTGSDDGTELLSQELASNEIGEWTLATFDFVAVNDSVRIKFEETSVDSKNTGPGIDTASLKAIPEPATFVIWSLLGGLGIIVTSWRRR